jgi:glycosyltransferase involved in cell wall biosynthesis
MKFSVLINNYNYGRFIVECVESVLTQTYPAHEIIVVDDGSTDDSVELVRRHFAARPEVRIIAQENQGQAMAIAVGIEAATGDIVCLLDADDSYKPDYLEILQAEYERRPDIDLIFCRAEAEPGLLVNLIWLEPDRDYDYGYTTLISYFGHTKWVGNNTSTISLRGRLARSLELKEAARQIYGPQCGGGDYPVLYAASLFGARKYYLHRSLVRYRVHGTNRSAEWRSDKCRTYLRSLQNMKCVNYYRERSHISEEMSVYLREEMRTAPDPLPSHLRSYREAIEAEWVRRTKSGSLLFLYKVKRKLKSWWIRLR